MTRKGESMKLDKETVKSKFDELRWKAACKGRKVIQWCSDNKEVLIVLVPVGAGLVKSGMNMHSKHVAKSNLKREKELQELYVYDRSLGMYHRLNKPLSSNQAIEIERRRGDGERMALILRDMKLI